MIMSINDPRFIGECRAVEDDNLLLRFTAIESWLGMREMTVMVVDDSKEKLRTVKFIVPDMNYFDNDGFTEDELNEEAFWAVWNNRPRMWLAAKKYLEITGGKEHVIV